MVKTQPLNSGIVTVEIEPDFAVWGRTDSRKRAFGCLLVVCVLVSLFSSAFTLWGVRQMVLTVDNSGRLLVFGAVSLFFFLAF